MLKNTYGHYNIISSKKKEMVVLQHEIPELQLALKPLQGVSEFTHF